MANEDIWGTAIASLRERIGQQNFDLWIKSISFVSMNGDDIELEVPNRFFKEWISEHFSSQIQEAISHLTKKECRIQFRIQNEKPDRKKYSTPPPQKREVHAVHAPQAVLNPKYTFDHFVVGPSNQFANAACLAVANLPAKNYNPLFIYGGVGLGKTHLLHAIGNRIVQNGIFPDPKKICYLSSEEFTNEMINSIRYEKMEEFRNKFRKMDILLIDDIQFISGKERTQAEFFFTFNSIYEARKQIVLTSDRFPKDIPHLEERLRSRFEWGLIADIQAPDVETKVAILKKKSEMENIPIPDDVAFFLASQIESNIRVLEGSLIRIGAFASLTKTQIDIQMAREVLKNVIKQKEELISIDLIQKVVSGFFNVKISDLKTKRKYKGNVFPRQVAMYLSRKLTNASLVEIGEKFGGKDHSTVIHSIKKVEEKMSKEAPFKEKIDTLFSRIKS